LLQAAHPWPAAAEDAAPSSTNAAPAPLSIKVLNDEPGSGTAAARPGDLLLFHYVGTLEDSGAVFDSTRGGQVRTDDTLHLAPCV
jgi:FKBP-type peptidyl-prolyl cis-trans isomerase